MFKNFKSEKKMAKLLKGCMPDITHVKKAPFYKLWWCALRHEKKIKIIPVSDWRTGESFDAKLYGCMKCNIWRRED
jgi:hypothetical protein